MRPDVSPALDSSSRATKLNVPCVFSFVFRLVSPVQLRAGDGCVPFLEEFVKPERFPSGLLRTGTVLRFRLFLPAVGCKGPGWTLFTGFGRVVVAAGDCNRSCHTRFSLDLSFASHHSQPTRAALTSCGRRGYIWCDSSPYGPLNTMRRAIG
jgi:hypothetical protein